MYAVVKQLITFNILFNHVMFSLNLIFTQQWKSCKIKCSNSNSKHILHKIFESPVYLHFLGLKFLAQFIHCICLSLSHLFIFSLFSTIKCMQVVFDSNVEFAGCENVMKISQLSLLKLRFIILETAIFHSWRTKFQ